MAQPESVDDFRSFEHTADSGSFAGRSYRVLTRGPEDGAPVIVMHELFGLSPGNLALCRFLSDDDPGFRVYAPVLFGTPGRKSQFGAARSKICLRHEFTLFRTNRTSPVVDWLRTLTSHVSGLHGGRSVGVIGMCMSGGFALALLAEPEVGVGVASQPSLPLAMFRGLIPGVQRDLGLDRSDRDRMGAAETPLVLLRYDDDWRCPAARADSVVELYGPAGEPVQTADPAVTASRGERLSVVTVDGSRHSVLTDDLNREARDLVARWLADALD